MEQTYQLMASILSANPLNLGDEVKAALAEGIDTIHIDVMDNHYVPNLGYGPAVCSALRKAGITAKLDVHLMVSPVDRLIERFARAGADVIAFHPEATQHPDRNLRRIQALGCQAAIALNPETSLQRVDALLPLVDQVVVMTVNPGFGGQTFLSDMLPKVQQLHARIAELDRPIRLVIDGGITAETIALAAQAGADTFIAGSAIFGHSDYKMAVMALRQALLNTTGAK